MGNIFLINSVLKTKCHSQNEVSFRLLTISSDYPEILDKAWNIPGETGWPQLVHPWSVQSHWFLFCCFKEENVISPLFFLLSPSWTILKYSYRNNHTHTEIKHTLCQPWEWGAKLADTEHWRHVPLKYTDEWDPKGQTWRRNIYESHSIFLSLHKGEKN